MSWRCSRRSLTCPGGPGPVLEALTVSNVGLRYTTYISPVCWNFEPFVLARTTTYRYEAKTHRSHVIGAHVGPTTLGKYWDLTWCEQVLVVV